MWVKAFTFTFFVAKICCECDSQISELELLNAVMHFAQKFQENFYIVQIAQSSEQKFVQFMDWQGAVRPQSQPHRQNTQKIRVRWKIFVQIAEFYF